MGSQRSAQRAFLCEFSLEEHVPQDHLIRAIGRFVDLAKIRNQLAPFYSMTGRPSIDPELMIRMLLVGYCFGIRSERRLCDEVHLNLVYRWFCRLDQSDRVPDHSTFSKNRHGRFRDGDLFRHLFESVLARCIAEGLVGGTAFGADASIIKAEASRYTVRRRQSCTEDLNLRDRINWIGITDRSSINTEGDVVVVPVRVDQLIRIANVLAGLGSVRFILSAGITIILIILDIISPNRSTDERVAIDITGVCRCC